ncbi:hypothetical protein [Nocardia abscessus]|uniref:hypothetical protein n=1 Tax=Nocardia abscessus TaxID=120957 RepID=UPI002458F0C1|nr:hypothetical protein [Nocardia abscessus]
MTRVTDATLTQVGLALTFDPSDPTYPISVTGTATLADGTVIGGVRHQFRDEPGGGFRSRLAVAFPAAVPGLYIAEHQWHLACGSGNWITAYLR